jgi:hypothetical protein
MDNEGSEFAAFGAQEDEKSVTDMPSPEGQWEETEDKGESGAQAQMHGRPRRGASTAQAVSQAEEEWRGRGSARGGSAWARVLAGVGAVRGRCGS